MDLKQISTAIAVAKYGSFSDAAEAASFSQSAVSKQVNSLEDELGVQLFNRGFQRQPVTLTKDGSEILEHLDKILEEYNAISKYIESSNSEETPVLKMGSIPTFGSFGEDRLIARFIMDNPDKQVLQVTGSAYHLANSLTSGDIDAMVAGSSETSLWPFKALNDYCQANRISRIPISECSLTVGVHVNHRFAKRKSIKLADLAGEKIIFKKNNPQVTLSPNRYSDLIEICKNADVEIDSVFVNDETNRIRPRLAAKGYGIMINLTPIMIPYSDLIFVPIEDYPYKATAFFLYQKNNKNIALKRMIDIAMRTSFCYGYSDKEFRIL